MKIKRHIPNIITLLNLFCGVLATMFAVSGHLMFAVYFVLLGIFFDFFDGFFARLLNVSGELGKQLDSLADVVTSGVVPGIILFQLIQKVPFYNTSSEDIMSWSGIKIVPLALIGLVFCLASAYRLAKFNIDTRQTSSFIGLPTPAATLVVLSLPLILATGNEWSHEFINNQWFLVVLTLLLSYLMHAEIPLFALKFKDYAWKNNKIKFSFLGVSLLLLIGLQFVAIPLIIMLYVLFSVIENRSKK